MFLWAIILHKIDKMRSFVDKILLKLKMIVHKHLTNENNSSSKLNIIVQNIKESENKELEIDNQMKFIVHNSKGFENNGSNKLQNYKSFMDI